jgi:hypothetical protein
MPLTARPLLIAGFLLVATAPAVANTSSQTSDFCNTLGVNIHSAAPQTSPETLPQMVAYLGFHHVRDGANDAETVDMRQFTNAGIKWDLIVRSDPQPYLPWLLQHKTDILLLEGPNEPDLELPKYQGLTGIPAARAMQSVLYQMVKSTPALHQIPVLNYAIGHPDFFSRLQPRRHDYDFANIHVYAQAGRPPRQALLTSEIQGAPTIVTETGYTTVQHNLFSARQGLEGIDEPTQAKYLLDTVFDDYNSKIQQTYLYDLIDDGPDPDNLNREKHFGLFHADGTPKIAATAFHNLTTLLGCAHNVPFQPQKLGFNITPTPNVQSILLQQQDGAFYLILWAEQNIWDAKRHSGTPPAQNYPVQVTFPSQRYDVATYDPLISPSPQTTSAHARAISVTITDHPVILQIETPRKP